MKTLNCLICSKQITPLYPRNGRVEWNAMWNGAIVDKVEAGFGSIFDTNTYLIAICDGCVKEKKLKPIK